MLNHCSWNVLLRFFSAKFLEGLTWWLRQWRICLQCGRPGFDPWIGKIPWKTAWQPIPVFLSGESPWTEEPGGLQSMGSQRVRHDWATKHKHMFLENLYSWNSKERIWSFWSLVYIYIHIYVCVCVCIYIYIYIYYVSVCVCVSRKSL